jgi:hypothetical protein
MKPYKNLSGDSGIVAYEYERDWIRVRFLSGEDYTYFRQGIGAANLTTMKGLADAGKGLATFINTHPKVRKGYSESTSV